MDALEIDGIAKTLVDVLEYNGCTFPVHVAAEQDHDGTLGLVVESLVESMDGYKALYPCNGGTAASHYELTSVAIVPSHDYVTAYKDKYDWVCFPISGYNSRWFACKTYDGSELVKHLPIPGHAVRKRFVCNPYLGVVYCLNYKAGCSYIASSVAGEGYKTVFNTTNRSNRLLGDLVSRVNDLFTFTVVRNPYSRVVSSYLDIIGGPIAEFTPRYAMFRRALDLPKAGIIEFGSFISRLEAKGFVWSLGSEHWLPQAVTLCSGIVKYDKVGMFEDMSSFLRKEVEPEMRSRGDTRPVIFPEDPIRVTGASKSYRSFYGNPTLAERVYKLYEIDFDLFKYSKQI